MAERWLVAFVVAAGCGRVGFDARTAGDGAPSADGSFTGRTETYIKASNTEATD